MADQHRRVEPRQIVGTGMATDPRRVEELEAERERFQRAWRDAPKKGFAEVLTETPARPPEDDEDDEDPRRRKKRQEEAAQKKAELETARVEAAAAAVAAPEKPADVEAKPARKVPPDPREALLRRMVERGGPPKKRGP